VGVALAKNGKRRNSDKILGKDKKMKMHAEWKAGLGEVKLQGVK